MGRTAYTEPQCLYKGALHFTFFQIYRTSPSATENTCVRRAPARIFCGNITSANRNINLHIEWWLVKQTVFPIHANKLCHKGSAPTKNVAG
jgi:hypothetical protein